MAGRARRIETAILVLCTGGLIVAAVMTSVWEKKPKKQAEDKPAVTVIMPQAPFELPQVQPAKVPDAHRYLV
jgi:hypothetical protein